MSKRTEIKTSFATVTRNESGIIIFRFQDDAVLDAQDIYEINHAANELCAGDKIPHLIITGLRMTVTKAGRAADIVEARIKNTLCEAIVINNLATRMAARLYYKFNPVPYTVRHFKTENEAIQWLRVNYIDKNEGTELHTGKMV